MLITIDFHFEISEVDREIWKCFGKQPPFQILWMPMIQNYKADIKLS
jgi:hypothetical protein